MARSALIKLRRGTGAPANNALTEGELAIDVTAKKLYSANSTGFAFTLSGDQYNAVQSGNATHGIITLTVDNTTLSNDSILVTGGTDTVVAGNSTVININSTSTLDTVVGRGSTTSKTIGVGNTTITGFANVSGSINTASTVEVGTSLRVGTTSLFDGAITVGNSTVNAAISSAGNIDTDGTLTVAGLSDLNGALQVAGLSTLTGNTTFTGFANVGTTLGVESTSLFKGAITVGNSTVNAVISSAGNINTDGTVTVAGNTAFNGANNEIAGQVNINDTTGSSSTGTGALVVDGGLGVAQNVYIGGNLAVAGTTTQINSTTVTIDDSLIKLAANQLATDTDAVDVGIYGTYDVGGTQKYSGVFRDTNNANKAWVFVDGITAEPGTTVTYAAGDLAYIEAIVDGGTY
jgi:hypothetical protein